MAMACFLHETKVTISLYFHLFLSSTKMSDTDPIFVTLLQLL